MIGKFSHILIVFLLCSIVTGVEPADSDIEIPVEYQVKAAFIVNFIKFVDWSEAAFIDSKSPVTISILGDTFLTPALKAIEDVPVKGRHLSIHPIKTLMDLKSSHILFISASEKHQIKEILQSVNGTSVLTVGEFEGFCDTGGIINFILVDNKVHFEINPDAAHKANLVISSKLLRLATIVRTQGNN